MLSTEEKELVGRMIADAIKVERQKLVGWVIATFRVTLAAVRGVSGAEMEQRLAAQERLEKELLCQFRIGQIQQAVEERDDSHAYQSACGEYNCPCHYDIPFLLQYIKEKLACQ